MIEFETDPWRIMIQHAEEMYPNECCGAMLGRHSDVKKVVTEALTFPNAWAGEKIDRYAIRPEDLLAADREARSRGLDVIGVFHSHPDSDAYFSAMDLKNSCPWYSFVVLSIQKGKFDHANSFLPDPDQTRADKEELAWQKF